MERNRLSGRRTAATLAAAGAPLLPTAAAHGAERTPTAPVYVPDTLDATTSFTHIMQTKVGDVAAPLFTMSPHRQLTRNFKAYKLP
ncbi:hypothetical protein [Streptomyces sp. ME19-01-6]|uniref:hypothetical protein n=1 Tax=Streptomyces sp. ME19-01-6 TaxID=3028686 RepID=UPI0029B93FC1|nr:hypothetical protein [Streptomyces sp. ME19-01-6]MDX3230487.1 hypothetical protein [Streptomyces sp. ME19-01-6]